MAGLLDYLPGYVRDLDRATEQFMPSNYWGVVGGGYDPRAGAASGGSILEFLKRLDRGTEIPGLGAVVSRDMSEGRPPLDESAGLNMAIPQYQSTYVPQDESAGLNMQRPQFQSPAPQLPSWAQSSQSAQNAFALPSSSYAQGGTNVPVYGQAPSPQADEASAQRRGVGSVSGLQINPQGNPVAPAAVAPGSTSTGRDRWMEFLDRLSPDYVSRYRQTKQQQQSAQNLSAFFQGQGMSPQQANAMAAVAAQNPKIMEEFFKQPATVEGAIARDMAFGTGGGRGNAQVRALDWMRNKNAAEKAGTVQGESQAQAQIDLPSAVASAKEQLRLLDELSNHPGRSQIGWHDPLGKAPLIPSTKGYDANNLLEQVKGGAFKAAFETLKGGGAITEQEGKAATAAIARMDRATSRAEFDRAVEDYKGILRLGMDRANQKAGRDAPFGFQGNQGWGQLPGGARFKKLSD